MSKKQKKEITINDLALMVAKGFMEIDTKLENCATKEDLKKCATKNDLENFATKEDLEEIKEKIEEVDKKIDEVSASVQIQKNVPLIKKVDEKVNKHIEIHKQRKNITEKDVEKINRINPFPIKPAITT